MSASRHRPPVQARPRALTDREIIAKARGRAPTKYSALVLAKHELSGQRLFSLFPQIFRNKADLESLHGIPFPAALEILLTEPRLTTPGSLVSELIWAISSAIQFSDELREFVHQRRKFERALLAQDRETVDLVLDDVQRAFGWSLWLIQNRLTVTQLWDGIDQRRAQSRQYDEQINDNNFLALLIRFISQRCEGTTVPGYLQGELTRAFGEDAAASDYFVYARVKLFELGSTPIDSMPATLSIESQACAIDYYETLIAFLQTIAADPSVPLTFADQLDRPVSLLYRRIRDPRLAPVVIALCSKQEEVAIDSKRAWIIEKYSAGQYAEMLEPAYGYIANHPDDVSMLALIIKVSIKIGKEIKPLSGLLGEVSENLEKVFRFSADAYAAAYSILRLNDRFFGQSWIGYARALVVSELAQEQEHYPTATLRRVYALDQYVTPFTQVLRRLEASDSFPAFIREAFPTTSSVYLLVSKGVANDKGGEVDAFREKKYLGRYYLHTGDYELALETFEWLADTAVTEEEKARAGACLALAQAGAGDLRSSTETLVSTYLGWPDVPTILPIPQLTEMLGKPQGWPNTISVPLLFELYANYFKDDRLPHLRYAFEKFQIDNDINQPEDFKLRVAEYGIEKVVMYLDKVWRPEVMRQTLLYEGTREIEEARVRVCRVLADIDSKNSSVYLNEIRERVKQQEIAKATNLVEQSKVYVDISAIKKALQIKLGDAYAKYKGAMQALPVQSDNFVEVIADLLAEIRGKNESIAKALSHSHILAGSATNELDVQFASMFSEVTNEFLNGDHGLNAYLSTRVRHGTLSNILRKSVADQRLITERQEGKTSYLPNEYWNGELSELREAQRVKLLQALDHFSENFDSIIDHVRDDLIQIAVIHELIDQGRHPSALFVYSSSNLERRYMQEYDKGLRNLGEFINRCVETLWEKTDENLAHVQQVLSTTIRTRFMNAFDRLSDEIGAVGVDHLIGALHDSIARARTDLQIKLAVVVSWFRRSEVYDRQDYSPDFAVFVATNMITNTMSAASGWQGVEVKCDAGSVSMPGRTLDGMVDISCALIENAITHSDLPISELHVKFDIRTKDGRVSVIVENNSNQNLAIAANMERLAALRMDIVQNQSRRKAQIEGKSGFRKIWATINAPQYRDPHLDFGFSDKDHFRVELDFGLEKIDEEDTFN
ncbi:MULTISPECIES: hypothetical protein [Burkholderia]|uniref:hypothetical protein n=1 Tax=Burkholderia TaxID=32008 RepID=UPI000B019D1B|nr:MULTISPECIES: hypothetical protein [Burkholderia]MBG0868222.1 hypothetical protein [Burkholderia sp. 9779_493]MDN7676932.1 hypothetical protein [Burkholderia cenocepacia]